MSLCRPARIGQALGIQHFRSCPSVCTAKTCDHYLELAYSIRIRSVVPLRFARVGKKHKEVVTTTRRLIPEATVKVKPTPNYPLQPTVSPRVAEMASSTSHTPLPEQSSHTNLSKIFASVICSRRIQRLIHAGEPLAIFCLSRESLTSPCLIYFRLLSFEHTTPKSTCTRINFLETSQLRGGCHVCWRTSTYVHSGAKSNEPPRSVLLSRTVL